MFKGEILFMKGELFRIVFRLSVVVVGISFLLFFGGGCSPTPVSTGTIQGVVTDNLTSQPIEGVLVTVSNLSTTSDSLGNYILNKVPIGDREVTAVIEGYSSQSETVEIIENEITELDFQLIPLSQENQRVVMVELYIAIGCHNCELVEPILEQLVGEYGFDHMILVEEAPWGDYSTPEISNRYKWYLPDNADRGVPNILFNGINENWIHGYANYQTIKSKIDAELAKEAKIVITVDSRNSDSNTTTITGTIENVSSSTLNNLEINGMVFKERPAVNLKYSVTDIFDEQKVEITSLAPGNIVDFSFTLEDFNWETDNVHGVIFVQAPDSPTKEILQAAYVE
jgi:thiol-disulfide isomerase/thioredoxin